eukprot:scaffold2141_cov282-Pinguiococcus_pyrenoidosus.AAC.4
MQDENFKTALQDAAPEGCARRRAPLAVVTNGQLRPAGVDDLAGALKPVSKSNEPRQKGPEEVTDAASSASGQTGCTGNTGKSHSDKSPRSASKQEATTSQPARPESISSDVDQRCVDLEAIVAGIKQNLRLAREDVSALTDKRVKKDESSTAAGGKEPQHVSVCSKGPETQKGGKRKGDKDLTRTHGGGPCVVESDRGPSAAGRPMTPKEEDDQFDGRKLRTWKKELLAWRLLQEEHETRSKVRVRRRTASLAYEPPARTAPEPVTRCKATMAETETAFPRRPIGPASIGISPALRQRLNTWKERYGRRQGDDAGQTSSFSISTES